MELITEQHAFYGVPVFKLQDVDEFNPSIGDPARIYDLPIGKGMRLRALVDPRSATNMVVRVGFHGAVPARVPTGDAFFEPGNIYKSREDPYILFADPTLSLNKELRLSWYLGAAWVDPDYFMEKMTRKLMAVTDACYMLAGGGSGGGFTAARFATRFKNGVASAKIPQTDVFRWPSGPLGRSLSYEWNWDRERILRTSPTRFRLADIYGDSRWNRGNLLHIVQNVGDTEHVDDHLNPFLRELGETEEMDAALDGQVTISRPYFGDGHAPVPPSLWQAEDDTALVRLKALHPLAPLEAPETMFEKPEGLQLSERQSRIREEHLASHNQL